MRVVFRTNLDFEHTKPQWPTELPCLPHVGDLVRSAQTFKSPDGDRVLPEIYLQLPKGRFKSIADFQQWFAWVNGRNPEYKGG